MGEADNKGLGKRWFAASQRVFWVRVKVSGAVVWVMQGQGIPQLPWPPSSILLPQTKLCAGSAGDECRISGTPGPRSSARDREAASAA